MHISYKMKFLSSRRKREVFSHIKFIYRISRSGPHSEPSACACVLRTPDFASGER